MGNEAHEEEEHQQQQQQEEEEQQQEQQLKRGLRRRWRSIRAVRLLVLVTLVFHIGLSALALVVAIVSSSDCPQSLLVAATLVAGGACVRVAWVVATGFSQAATAVTMISEEEIPASRLQFQGSSPRHPQAQVTRLQRRLWYRRWLWWGRLGAIVTFLQVAVACYLSFLAVRGARCYSGSRIMHNAVIVLPVIAWLLVSVQCCVGSDVLSWRSLYEMQNEAWRAHYREMFDHGIRELLCCLGRPRYMTIMDEDEVDAVAALLGDLVAYRAAGASHLEFLAGVALLRARRPSPVPSDLPSAPEPLMKEAAYLHPYAVAAYTGLLLDIGRNPFFFGCAWMYRQGLFSLWNRHRRPRLDGDNWWRGHATAFLRAARVPAEALLKGRVHQKHREIVYFVIELRELRCVVIAVRGTETPEDLLTDGLGRECVLSDDDIHGLLMSEHLPETTKQELLSSTPHYGHAGVICAARELAFELESPEDNPEYEQDSQVPANKRVGFLTSILGPGGKCEGFALRFVGHSLGGSIAAVAGMMLWHRFPDLHVYGYGILPCVDAVVAEACSSFVTSIVYNDEFSSRLSVASLMRLRAASLRALATDSETDSAVIARLARRLLGSSRQHRRSSSSSRNGIANGSSNSSSKVMINKRSEAAESLEPEEHRRRLENRLKGGVFLCYHACHCVLDMPKESGGYNKRHHESHLMKLEANADGFNIFSAAGTGAAVDEAVELMKNTKDEGNEEFVRGIVNGDLLSNGIPSESQNDLVGFKPGDDLQQMWPVELVMPGLIIHLLKVDRKRGGSCGWWSSKKTKAAAAEVKGKRHIAVVRDRDSFRDIVVSPSMFLDHMPWRCQRALNDLMEQLGLPPAEIV